jgi:hypothetical protein
MTDLEILRADLVAARLPGHRTRVAILAVAAAATITAAALAANHYLGQPAPAHVNATFAQIMNRGPRLPGVRLSSAKVVALSPHSVLFGADATDGSYCTELVTHGGTTYSVGCGDRRQPDILRLYPPMPFRGSAASPPPYVLVGRISERGSRLEARQPDGTLQSVPVGVHGAFLFEAKHQAAARAGAIELIERDSHGNVTGRAHVPPQVVVKTGGEPVRRVTGLITAPNARYVEIEVWTLQRLTDKCRNCRGVVRPSFAQSGEVKLVALDHGRFSYTTSPQKSPQWFLSLNVLDERYIPLENTSVMSVPDPSFWARARDEARRNGV